MLIIDNLEEAQQELENMLKGTFGAASKKVVVERASLREQCAWSHEPKDEDTQFIADDLIRMFVSKVSRMKVDVPFEEEINDIVMVVGGGLAGAWDLFAPATSTPTGGSIWWWGGRNRRRRRRPCRGIRRPPRLGRHRHEFRCAV